MADQTRSDIALLYRRAGFGLRPDELDAMTSQGYEAAVAALLAGLGDAPDPGGDSVALPALSGFQRSTASAGSPEALVQNKARNKVEQQDLKALQVWWMNRMIQTSTPLREKLTLFWHGHFATGSSKVRDAKLMYLQNQLFRSAGGGGFDSLTQAVAKDGAMMVWLDTATDKKAHPNENFAREMMELFTLGIGNYTQDDVTAAARAFTGWAYDRVGYSYVFRPGQHDYGTKTYLGRTGDWNGDDIVSIAVNQADSARFVVAKLWSHFAYPVQPSDPVLSDVISAYGSALDIGSALGAIFRHPAFLSPASRSGLVKQPVEYLVGAARALGLDAEMYPSSSPSGLSPGSGSPGSGSPGSGSSSRVGVSPPKAVRTLATLATALGQTPFDPPNVGGWGQNDYWLDTATAQVRLEAALVVARKADLSTLDATPAAQRGQAVADLLGIDGWGPTTAGVLGQVSASSSDLVALALVSPEYVLA